MGDWTKEKATKYKNDFIAKAYDRVNLTMPKGMKDKAKAHAESKGMSLNGYINELIKKDMEQINGSENE